VIVSEKEDSILRDLASGDPATVEAIYRDNYPSVEGFIIRNNGTYDDARDVFQEAVIVLYEKALSGNFVLTSRLNTFLYAVCKRIWLKKLQQQQRFHNTGGEISDVIFSEEELEQHERKNQEFATMESALKKVGEPCKSLLEAYYLEKKSMPEIADQFGYTNADNAKNQKYKCLVRLKKLFFAQYKNGG
jgi:RNA polymerase sigma factor (sigma-70 family)